MPTAVLKCICHKGELQPKFSTSPQEQMYSVFPCGEDICLTMNTQHTQS